VHVQTLKIKYLKMTRKLVMQLLHQAGDMIEQVLQRTILADGTKV
jgi:hypothetical protein